MPMRNFPSGQWSGLKKPSERTYLRHDRFFHVMNEGWYLEVRSGVVGPFETHKEAEEYLSHLTVNPAPAKTDNTSQQIYSS